MMNRLITFFIINLVFITVPGFGENTDNWPRLRGADASGLPKDDKHEGLPIKWSKT